MKNIFTLPKQILVGVSLVLLTQIAVVHADTVPKVLAAYLEKDKEVRGEVVKLDVPREFVEFELLINKAREKDPKWFNEHMKKTAAVTTIPGYHENLGMTKAEYDNFMKIWDKRKYKKQKNGDVTLKLIQSEDKTWSIKVTGLGTPISLIKYNPAEDSFKSVTGVMERIEDIDSPANSVYREWKGQEWRFLQEDSLMKVKENIAIGRTADKRYGILIYSLREVTNLGTPLADRLMIIRFVPKKIQ